jgi:hypothetical protein
MPNLTANTDVLTLLQAQDLTYNPAASQSVNQYQKENNQYSQLVWRHDVDAANFFSLGLYFRRGEADFHTPSFDGLAYADNVNSAQTANQRRTAYTGGGRLDHTWVPNSQHLVKTGLQIDYTNANNTSQIFAFDTSGGAPTGISNGGKSSGFRTSGVRTISGRSIWAYGLTSFRSSTPKGKSVPVSAPHTNTTNQTCSMPFMAGCSPRPTSSK